MIRRIRLRHEGALRQHWQTAFINTIQGMTTNTISMRPMGHQVTIKRRRDTPTPCARIRSFASTTHLILNLRGHPPQTSPTPTFQHQRTLARVRNQAHADPSQTWKQDASSLIKQIQTARHSEPLLATCSSRSIKKQT